MAKVLVLYYSMYGHVRTLAEAVAEGARGTGAEVALKRVPETMSDEALERAGAAPKGDVAVAEPGELGDYDAILFGTPTRFGNMAGQMRTFLDQTGGLWMKGGLVGKVGSVFTSTGTGGGNETTIVTFWMTLAHHGMVIVGNHYGMEELQDLSVVKGGSPYGSATIAGSDGSRQPLELELSMCRQQGARAAELAAKLAG